MKDSKEARDVTSSTPPSPNGSSPSSGLEKDHNEDIEEQHEEQDESNAISRLSSALYPEPSKTIVSFERNDPGNPFEWSHTRRMAIVLIGILTVLNSTMGSSIPSGISPEISKHFGVTNEEQLVLPISIFIVGYILGPIIFSPISEEYGRQGVMYDSKASISNENAADHDLKRLITFGSYTIFTMAVCVAPNFAALIVFRLFCGIFASSPISVIGGIYADLYDNPVHRGRAMAIFMTGTSVGPITGPVISGYLGVYGWRYPFLFALGFACFTWIPLAFFPETYGPEILRRRAKKIRKETGSNTVYAPIELENTRLKDIVTKVLTRPFRMFFTEAIVLFSCLFMCLIYGIFYELFQVFPEIYAPIYGFSLGEEGLAFLPIGVGAVIACGIYLWWDSFLAKAKARDAAWARSEEARRLPLACIGGPFFVIGIFWIGWAARPSVHWIVPMLGGIPFGIGFLLLFMALINYLVDAYEVFAASAMAAGSCSRSTFGAVLPFSGKPMFEALGIAWACSLLGFISIAMCIIPFVFIRYGDKLRANSKFCNELKAQKKEQEEKDEQRRKREEYWAERRARQSAGGDDAENVHDENYDEKAGAHARVKEEV